MTLHLNRDIEAAEQIEDVPVGACKCGKRWNGDNIAHCATCHLTFTAVGGFDFHRFHGQCRTEEELRGKGYEPNSDGHWRKPMTEAEVARRTSR